MLQRIQTIYLALVATCSSFTLFFKFSSYQLDVAKPVVGDFNAFGCTVQVDNILILAFPPFPLLVISAFLAVISILLYQKRALQLKLNRLNYLVILGTIVLIFVYFGQINEQLTQYEPQVSYGIGMFLPIAALAFNLLANRAIKRDEKLVKSLDRLR